MYSQRRRKRIRLHGFDYSQNRCYFITICTKNRIPYFGRIYHNIMCLNELGSIVWQQWKWLETQYPYIRLHVFVVMPNHVHGIIEIDSELAYTDDNNITSTDASAIAVRAGRTVRAGHVEEGLDPPLRGTKIHSLSQLIGAFKTTSSKLIHHIGITPFQWQRSFHDHIIRDEIAYHNIYRYIINNPRMWDRDRNNM